mmetsp:Transcript_8937/g.19471  ORF Transcript_8937/g.19471 Transcript_8937/m.19471 type:complete len:92 (+) Transcript_8937:395-670(+)
MRGDVAHTHSPNDYPRKRKGNHGRFGLAAAALVAVKNAESRSSATGPPSSTAAAGSVDKKRSVFSRPPNGYTWSVCRPLLPPRCICHCATS